MSTDAIIHCHVDNLGSYGYIKYKIYVGDEEFGSGKDGKKVSSDYGEAPYLVGYVK